MPVPTQIRRRQARVMGQEDPWVATTADIANSGGYGPAQGGGNFSGVRPTGSTGRVLAAIFSLGGRK